MSRLTKSQSEAKKTKISEMLAKHVPWAEIVKELGCSFQTISIIANGSNRSDSQVPDSQIPNSEIEGLKEINAKLAEELAAVKTGFAEFYNKFLAMAKDVDNAIPILGTINPEIIDGGKKYL